MGDNRLDRTHAYPQFSRENSKRANGSPAKGGQDMIEQQSLIVRHNLRFRHETPVMAYWRA